MSGMNPQIVVSGRHRGFTLIEILIVVVILGILAVIVVPQFAGAAKATRETNIQTTLQRVRTQLELYRMQHGAFPTLTDIKTQMTGATNIAGETAALGTADYPFGPYLQQFPVNPNTSGETVGTGAVGDSDWYYNPSNGDFRANDSDISRSW